MTAPPQRPAAALVSQAPHSAGPRKIPILGENGQWLSGCQIIWRVCGNCRTLHLPEKWHQLSTRRFQRGKLIYGRNAHKSCYFLMGFGSLFLTPCFEMYPTAYSINEFKHSDFLVSRNHSSLGFDFFFVGFFNASVKN